MSRLLLLLLVLLCAVEAREFREYTLPYEPTVKNECKDRDLEYYNKNARMCCSKCPPGHHLSQECRNTTDSECKPCGPNAYTEVWNRLRQCHHCEFPCREDSGLIETQACNASHSRICGCVPDKYCVFESFTSCQVCADRTICQKGFGVSKAGTMKSNTVCSPCPAGTFSDEESYTSPCKPHTKCRSLSVPGDSTRDAICSDSGVGTDPTRFTHSVILSPSEAGKPVSELNDLETLDEIWTPLPARVAARKKTAPLGIICGGVLFAMVGLAGIAFLFVSRKARYCPSKLRTETTCLDMANEKKISQGHRIPSDLNYNSPVQEQELLLKNQRLSACSLEPMPGSAILGEKPEKIEASETPRGSLTSKGMINSNGLHMNSERSCNGNCLVNLTCTVNVGNGDHPSWVANSAAEPQLCHTMKGSIPQSNEEHHFHEPGALLSFEEFSLHPKGELLPLGIEDTERKASLGKG